jgi:hypothetical protein
MDDFKQIKATKTLDMICKTFISFGSNMFIKHVLKKVVFRHPLYLAECMLVVGGLN